ncbi:hypothetical protein [Vagococcus fluvialis]|uniref:hypothetical protein n=1 Tax=Vagococcus fluvialis TaxID=2738 RepID=UPI003D0ABE84
MKSKLLNSSITIICTLFLLSGCSEKKSTNSEISSTKESQISDKTTELPLSKALPKYTVWYLFKTNEVTKDTKPSAIFYFDGEHVEEYKLTKPALPDTIKIHTPFELLTISQIINMSIPEQLKYATQQINNPINVTLSIPNQGNINDLIDIDKDVKPLNEKPLAPYNLNIITDGSGNNTKQVELTTVTNFLTLNSDYTDILWKQAENKLEFLSSYNQNIQIFDHNLNGFSLSKNELLLTDTKDETISFYLDDPKVNSKNIKVDSNVNK